MKLLKSIVYGFMLALPVGVLAEPTDYIAKIINQDVQKKRDAQKRVQSAIYKARIELEQVRREIQDLSRRQQTAWGKLQKLQERLQQLQTEIGNSKAQISRLIASNYRNQQPNAVALFLKNADSSQKSRFLEYTRLINEANDKLIVQLGEQEQELSKQEVAVENELLRLQRLTVSKQAKLKQLSKITNHKATGDTKLSAEIKRYTAQLNKIKEDEKRLNNVLANINKDYNAKKRAQAQQKTQDLDKPKNTADDHQSTSTDLTAEDLALTASNEVFAEGSGGLNHLQGRLQRPVSGTITGTFGQSRQTGGVWRGIFIKSAPAEVRNIAEGEVQFADDLAGYGQTIIVDHGAGYLSVYAGLSNMNVEKGKKIPARHIIGSSGVLPTGEEGLYLEIRYRHQPVNPQTWVR